MMKLFPKTRARTALFMAAAAVPSVAVGVSWTNKNVAQLQAMYSGSNCVYFRLQGVTEADPVLPGQPWFAFPRTQNGAQDAYAALLAAKAAGLAVQVNTDGTTSCGYATAVQVILE